LFYSIWTKRAPEPYSITRNELLQPGAISDETIAQTLVRKNKPQKTFYARSGAGYTPLLDLLYRTICNTVSRTVEIVL
jgi:hypothetical protein